MKKSNKLSESTIQTLISRHIGYLDHFIQEGGWPLAYNTSEFPSLLKSCKWLHLDKENRLARNKKVDIDPELLAAYWEFRFKEVEANYYRLKDLTEDFYKKTND